MDDLKIKNLNDLVEAVTFETNEANRQYWWRGHSVWDWKLEPKLYRDKRETDEQNLFAYFRRQARVRYPNCPDTNEIAAWLFLMRHYGLPTRLLDWSESPLVALYFAVREEAYSDRQGALLGLRVDGLNENQIGMPTVLAPEIDEVKRLCMDATRHPSKKESQKILGVIPELFDLRHLMQSAVFTIHGKSGCLLEMQDLKKFIVKLEIPATSKNFLRNSLKTLKINDSVLFPDLENLSKYLDQLKFA